MLKPFVCILDYKAIVLKSIICHFKLLKDLTEAEMCWNTYRVELDTMSEILFSLVEVSTISKLCGQMNA